MWNYAFLWLRNGLINKSQSSFNFSSLLPFAFCKSHLFFKWDISLQPSFSQHLLPVYFPTQVEAERQTRCHFSSTRYNFQTYFSLTQSSSRSLTGLSLSPMDWLVSTPRTGMPKCATTPGYFFNLSSSGQAEVFVLAKQTQLRHLLAPLFNIFNINISTIDYQIYLHSKNCSRSHE